MTMPKHWPGANQTTTWFDELEDLGEIDINNVKGMGRTLRRGLIPTRGDMRTARGNKRFARNV
jgi:hypothetical protein